MLSPSTSQSSRVILGPPYHTLPYLPSLPLPCPHFPTSPCLCPRPTSRHHHFTFCAPLVPLAAALVSPTSLPLSFCIPPPIPFLCLLCCPSHHVYSSFPPGPSPVLCTILILLESCLWLPPFPLASKVFTPPRKFVCHIYDKMTTVLLAYVFREATYINCESPCPAQCCISW